MTRPGRLPLACWRDRRGAAAVETALVLPVLLSLVMGTIEVGRLGWTQAALTFAVQEAGRCAEVTPAACGNAADVATVIKARMGLPQTTAGLTVTRGPTATCSVQVEATYAYAFMAAKIFSSAPKLTARVCRA
jgi:Flp pilus assembly protein TadG